MKDVENDIRFALLKDKKAELISAEFTKNNQAGKTLDDLSRDMGLEVTGSHTDQFQVIFGSGHRNGACSYCRSIIGKAKVLLSGPVKGINGVYMLTVNSITMTCS